jgi:peroxiredoxin
MTARHLIGTLFLLPLACGGPTSPASEAPTETQPPPSGAPTASSEQATPAVAENPAPDFTLKDLDGNAFTLSAMRGKTVVLEWFNPGCPFVKYAHGEGPLKGAAAKKMSEGITWLNINSGAPGLQGHGVETNRKARQTWEIAAPILIDESGKTGQAYGAKTTPHMFVIDVHGSIVYKGALDNAPLGRAPAEGYVNYVDAALADLAANRPVAIAETPSYGCSVKYSE